MSCIALALYSSLRVHSTHFLYMGQRWAFKLLSVLHSSLDMSEYEAYLSNAIESEVHFFQPEQGKRSFAFVFSIIMLTPTVACLGHLAPVGRNRDDGWSTFGERPFNPCEEAS